MFSNKIGWSKVHNKGNCEQDHFKNRTQMVSVGWLINGLRGHLAFTLHLVRINTNDSSAL